MAQDAIRAATIAHARAHQTRDPEVIATAKTRITEAQLEWAVEKALAAAPPLTTEQRERIAHLLLTGGTS